MDRNTLCQLHQAFTDGDVEQIRDILLNNAAAVIDINHRDQARGLQTVLMRLCHLHMDQSERWDILQLILDKDPEINCIDSGGRTALTHACIAERTDVIRRLAALPQCDPDLADEDGNTALIYAVKSRRADIVHVFLQCFGDRADVNIVNNKGVCALTEAESRCDSDICRLLIREGNADVTALEYVNMSRDVRSHRNGTPGSPIPDGVPLCSSPLSPRHNRRRNKGKSAEVLSPLVTTRLPPPPPQNYENLDHVADHVFLDSETEMVNPLSDVLEEEEGLESDEGYAETASLHCRDRRNSLSMPDLRETCGSLMASTPSSGAASYVEESFPKFDGRLERRRTQNTFVDESVLSQVSEEDEPESIKSGYPVSARRKRRGSLSLPDLRDCGQGLVAIPVDSENDGTEEEEEDARAINKGHKVTYKNLSLKGDGDRLVRSHDDSTLKSKSRLPQLNIGLDLDINHRGSLPSLATGHKNKGFSPSSTPRNTTKRKIGLGLIPGERTYGANRGAVSRAQPRGQDCSPRLTLTGERISRAPIGKR